MKILVVVPIYNEEKYLEQSLSSFHNQTYSHISWVLVNDNSTDNSRSIIEKYIENKSNFRLLNLSNTSEHQPGAKVICAFYQGLNSVNYKDFNIIAKLDADIILPNNYFQVLSHELEKDSQVGIIGGLLYIEDNNKWSYENISNKQQVRGPIKTYRKECFEDMGGLRKTLGWDNLDILLAKMHHWKIRTIPSLKVKHLKPTAHIYKKSKAEKLGIYFYNIGLNRMLAFISIAKSSWKEKSFKNFIISYHTFLSLYKENKKRVITQEEIAFIRKYRWNEIFGKFRFTKNT